MVNFHFIHILVLVDVSWVLDNSWHGSHTLFFLSKYGRQALLPEQSPHTTCKTKLSSYFSIAKVYLLDLSTLLFAITPLIPDGFQKFKYQMISFIKHHSLPVKSQLYVLYLYFMAHCTITTSCVAFVAGQLISSKQLTS